MSRLAGPRPFVFSNWPRGHRLRPRETRAYIRLQKVLESCDVVLDGTRPWDPQIHDVRLFRRVMLDGTRGVGDAYVDGWWDCDALDDLFARILRANLGARFNAMPHRLAMLSSFLFNRQKPSRAAEIAHRHYNLDECLFRTMLDSNMVYTCAYWKGAETLEEAQLQKLDLVCQKLHLQPNLRVLDIGCGWGGAARYVAEHYGARVLGITVSEPQAAQARRACRGLPVEIRVQDYREVCGNFDRIFSLGMFEHVGPKNYSTFFKVARRLLREDGLFLLHTIGSRTPETHIDPWIERYIFPRANLPSLSQISKAAEGLFVVEDVHNFGSDYAKTLLHWFRNFDRSWTELAPLYDSRFYRLWKYYLLSSSGGFRARANQLFQIVLSPKGVSGGYLAVR